MDTIIRSDFVSCTIQLLLSGIFEFWSVLHTKDIKACFDIIRRAGFGIILGRLKFYSSSLWVDLGTIWRDIQSDFISDFRDPDGTNNAESTNL